MTWNRLLILDYMSIDVFLCQFFMSSTTQALFVLMVNANIVDSFCSCMIDNVEVFVFASSLDMKLHIQFCKIRLRPAEVRWQHIILCENWNFHGKIPCCDPIWTRCRTRKWCPLSFHRPATLSNITGRETYLQLRTSRHCCVQRPPYDLCHVKCPCCTCVYVQDITSRKLRPLLYPSMISDYSISLRPSITFFF